MSSNVFGYLTTLENFGEVKNRSVVVLDNFVSTTELCQQTYNDCNKIYKKQMLK